MTGSQQFCTFYVGKQFFGVPVQHVQEVIRHQEMTRVPLAPEAIRGLINLRGQIVTAIDLRHCLGMPERHALELPMNVVVRTSDGAVSLLVDEIGDVLDLDPNTFEGPPETLHGSVRAAIRGVYKLPGQLLLELDIVHAVAAGEKGKGGMLART